MENEIKTIDNIGEEDEIGGSKAGEDGVGTKISVVPTLVDDIGFRDRESINCQEDWTSVRSQRQNSLEGTTKKTLRDVKMKFHDVSTRSSSVANCSSV